MKADRDKVVPLIKTARGQLDGILKMIDEDRYCIDISNQVLAVISILGKANKEIIRAHLAGCVKDSLTGGTPEEVETKLDEVMSVLDKIVYIADYIEPNRREIPGLSKIRQIVFQNIDQAICLSSERTIRYLEDNGNKIDPMTIKTYEFYGGKL